MDFSRGERPEGSEDAMDWHAVGRPTHALDELRVFVDLAVAFCTGDPEMHRCLPVKAYYAISPSVNCMYTIQ